MLLLLLPGALAVTITQPSEDITSETLPTTQQAAWEGNSTEYFVILTKNGEVHTNITTNQTTHTLNLNAGEYELTVQTNTTQDTTQFTVEQEQPALDLSISAHKHTYEVQEQVQLRATTNRPVTATLDILVQSEVVDTYSIPIESSVNLIWIPEQAGQHTARITAENTTATTTFDVQERPPLVIDFTHQEPRVNRPTQFNATATGGTPPYTYTWLFSDETTSTGRQSLHYFFEEGPHSATLIVTDNEGVRESITKEFTVVQPSFDLEVIVRQETGTLVQGATVTLHQTTNHTRTTSSNGIARFTQLRGNYTLAVTHQEVRVSQDIDMRRDRTEIVTLPAPEETPEEDTTTEDSEQAEEHSEEPAADTNQAVEDSEQPMVDSEPQETLTTQEHTLEQERERVREKIQQKRFNFQLSASQDAVLSTLGLYEAFDNALRQVDRATQTQLNSILASLPHEIEIPHEETRITYPDPEDVQEWTETFLEVRGIQDTRLQRQYRHSIREVSKEVSIRTTTKHARIHYEDRTEDYVLVRREVTAPEESTFIEFIPRTLAQDVSRLSVQGEFDVLRANPVLRFQTHEYSYWAQTTHRQLGYTLVVPEQLRNPPSLLGMVTVRFGETSPTRGILYIVLLGIFLVGIVAGGKVGKKRQETALFEEFTELTHMALDAIQQGRGAHAAQLTPEIQAIYADLGEEQQAALKDVIEHLKANTQEQHFLATLQSAYETIQSNKDINAISHAYETTLNAYETLPHTQKEHLKEHIDQLHHYLDAYAQ